MDIVYTVIPARNNSALSEDEKGLELFDLDRIYKRQSYDEQKEWLLTNTNLFASQTDDSLKPSENVEDLA